MNLFSTCGIVVCSLSPRLSRHTMHLYCFRENRSSNKYEFCSLFQIIKRNQRVSCVEEL